MPKANRFTELDACYVLVKMKIGKTNNTKGKNGTRSKSKHFNPMVSYILTSAYFENPYPNKDEKMKLMKLTKLSKAQIDYWFGNQRRRL